MGSGMRKMTFGGAAPADKLLNAHHKCSPCHRSPIPTHSLITTALSLSPHPSHTPRKTTQTHTPAEGAPLPHTRQAASLCEPKQKLPNQPPVAPTAVVAANDRSINLHDMACQGVAA